MFLCLMTSIPSRSAEWPALYRRPVCLRKRRQDSVYHGRQLEHHRSLPKTRFPPGGTQFKVHFDGADFEALTYRVSFGEADSDGRQAVRLNALTGSDAPKDSAAGELVLEGRTGEPALRANAATRH